MWVQLPAGYNAAWKKPRVRGGFKWVHLEAGFPLSDWGRCRCLKSHAAFNLLFLWLTLLFYLYFFTDLPTRIMGNHKHTSNVSPSQSNEQIYHLYNIKGNYKYASSVSPSEYKCKSITYNNIKGEPQARL